MNRGSGLSLGSSKGPAPPCLSPLPPLPSSVFHTASPNNPTPGHSTHAHKQIQSRGADAYSLFHTRQLKPRESVVSLCSLSLADTEAFCGWITPPLGHYQLLSRLSRCTWVPSAAVDLLRRKFLRVACREVTSEGSHMDCVKPYVFIF